MKARPLIPHPPATLEDERRLTHRDLATLSDEQLDAERVLLRIELADRVFHRRRAEVVDTDLSTGKDTTALDWLRTRLALLGQEHARRQERTR